MASKFESSVQKASDIIYDYPCTSCEEDDLNAEAFYFCGQCVKLFCNECVKPHNQLYKRHTLLGRKDVSQWGSVKKDVRGEMCELHPGNAIQMYCRDHDDVCCTVCVSLKHRPCKAIDHVPDVAKGIYKDANFKALPANLTKVQTKLNKKQERKKKIRKDLQESCKKVVASVKELRKRVNKLMDQLEKRTVEGMDRLLAIFDATLESDIDTCTRIHDELKQFLDNLQDKGMKRESDGYICYKKCQQKMSEADDQLITMTDEEYEILFQIDPQIEQYLSSLQTLGQFETSPAPGKTDHTLPALQTRTPTLGKTSDIYTVKDKQKYNLKMTSDNNMCCIWGMRQLPNGNFVAVDHLNMMVKQLNDRYAVIAHCQLPFKPNDICNIADMEVAITGSGQMMQGIQFINARNGKLELTKKINLDHHCGGIAHHHGKLYVCSSTALYIYTLAGKLEKKIYEDTSGTDTVYKFAVDGRRIYVTNYRKSLLMTLDDQGNQLASLSDPDLLKPTGVCVASNDTLLVCGHTSKTVVQVGSDGKKILATVARERDGVNLPWSLIFNKRTCELIVGQQDNDASLLVLTLK